MREPQHFIQSLARGLSVLQSFSSVQSRLTLTDLVEKTGMNKTAVQRYTDTLVHLGFLERNRHKEFFLGLRVLSLGFSYLQGSHLRQLAATCLGEFSEKTGYTTNLSVLDGDEIVILYRREVRRHLDHVIQTGFRLPSHCTAAGKVLLAALSDADLEERVSRMNLERMTSHTITDRTRLLEEIRQTRARGYALTDREMSLAYFSVGVPVINMEGVVAACINVAISADNATERGLKSTIEGVLEEGLKFSSALGYVGEYPLIPFAKDGNSR